MRKNNVPSIDYTKYVINTSKCETLNICLKILSSWLNNFYTQMKPGRYSSHRVLGHLWLFIRKKNRRFTLLANSILDKWNPFEPLLKTILGRHIVWFFIFANVNKRNYYKEMEQRIEKPNANRKLNIYSWSRYYFQK